MTDGVTLAGDELIATRHLGADPTLVWTIFTTPELQTEQARTGLGGILERLDELVRVLTLNDRTGTS